MDVRQKHLKNRTLNICKGFAETFARLVTAMFEIQDVMQRSTFEGVQKSLVELRKCSNFADDFAKK